MEYPCDKFIFRDDLKKQYVRKRSIVDKTIQKKRKISYRLKILKRLGLHISSDDLLYQDRSTLKKRCTRNLLFYRFLEYLNTDDLKFLLDCSIADLQNVLDDTTLEEFFG